MRVPICFKPLNVTLSKQFFLLDINILIWYYEKKKNIKHCKYKIILVLNNKL